MVIQAIYENGVFRPTEPVELPENCAVRVFVDVGNRASSHATSNAPLGKLAAIAADHPQNPNLPTDLAEQHDHYLYGAAKHR